jgi:hypothetical protein
MSKKQVLALKVQGQKGSQFEIEEMDSRCADGLENYQKLRQIFPWLAEEDESYL